MVRDLAGWQRLAVAFGLGGLAALAFAPLYVFPVLVISFTGLVFLMDGLRLEPNGLRSAFAVGWSFGAGFFLVGLHWVVNAFLVQAEMFAWMIPFVVIGLPAGLGLFIGAATAAAHGLGGAGPGRILILAAMWALAEWVRGHVLTGFPWNLIGYAWADMPAVAQTASLVGTYGLSLLTVAIAALPAAFVSPHAAERGRLSALPLALGLLALTAGALIYGQLRLSERVELVPDVRLRLVHADIAQRDKFDAVRRPTIVPRYLALTGAPPTDADRPPTHIIWPEAAVPYFLSLEPDLLAAIAAALQPGQMLLTGAPRYEQGPDGERYFNSFFAVEENGQVVATYDKSHLVPFGEYIPLNSLLRPLGVEKLTGGAWGFDAGAGPATLSLPGLPPLSPLICYEAIFPAEVTATGDRPRLLLNLTDDSWFGKLVGPQQHFDHARMRAVEEGLPLVRAANLGTSAVIDPYGRVRTRLGRTSPGFVDADLPAAKGATAYGLMGDTMFLLLWISASAVGFWLVRREEASLAGRVQGR